MVLDAGLKALSAEHGMSQPAIPGAFESIALADEHATARVSRDSEPIAFTGANHALSQLTNNRGDQVLCS